MLRISLRSLGWRLSQAQNVLYTKSAPAGHKNRRELEEVTMETEVKTLSLGIMSGSLAFLIPGLVIGAIGALVAQSINIVPFVGVVLTTFVVTAASFKLGIDILARIKRSSVQATIFMIGLAAGITLTGWIINSFNA